MNTIWEVFLEAEKVNGTADGVNVKPAKVSSPYYELSLDFLNEAGLASGMEVEMNPIYRYPKVFQKYLTLDAVTEDEQEKRCNVFNQIMHYFYEIERYRHYTKEDCYIWLCIEEIKEGTLGKEIAQEFYLLTKREQQMVGSMVLKSYQLGLSLELLGEAARCLFPFCYVYQDDIFHRVLIYPGVKKDSKSQSKLDLLHKLFVPIGRKMEVFWQHHFGIIDEEETMVLNEIELD